tara:strand:+ start:748 stop:1278 length:531 start_codon:yes stop_codon:yes gene_type:complete
MYTGLNENQLILPNIVDALHDYCSIQLDIDETKCKSSQLLAQNIDIKRVIGDTNLQRCIEDPTGTTPMTDADKQLKALIIPCLCWYTYSRLLLLFHTTFTDSGLISASDDGAEERNAAKSLAKECKGVAESMMFDVLEFLTEEADADPTIDTTEMDAGKLTPSIRVMGGHEWRASN